MEVAIDVYGLEVFGYHGVLPDERREGQPFLFDVNLVAHDAGVRSDRLTDTIDYTEVVTVVREISDGKRYNLIEALAADIADSLISRFDVSRVRVRVRKPAVQLALPAEFTAATVERTRR